MAQAWMLPQFSQPCIIHATYTWVAHYLGVHRQRVHVFLASDVSRAVLGGTCTGLGSLAGACSQRGALASLCDQGVASPAIFLMLLQVSFDWGWDKGILSGSGYGDLRLTDGAIDMIFTVKTETKGIPHVQTATASFSFDSLDLDVHSYSFDWLYQALLFLFSGTIKDNIEGHVHDALLNDVPVAINDVLDTLPAQVRCSTRHQTSCLYSLLLAGAWRIASKQQ